MSKFLWCFGPMITTMPISLRIEEEILYRLAGTAFGNPFTLSYTWQNSLFNAMLKVKVICPPLCLVTLETGPISFSGGRRSNVMHLMFICSLNV